MTTRTRRAAVPAVCALLIVSAACGDGGQDEAAARPSSTTTVTAATATTGAGAPTEVSQTTEAAATSAGTTASAPSTAAPATTVSPSAPPQAAAGPVVADHTTTDPSGIPDEWRRAAADVVWAYGSTSHGTQLWSGALRLAERDERFPFAMARRSLPSEAGLRMGYDDGWWWDPETFTGEGRALLADIPEATVFMWSWCGELSDPATDVHAYLEAMDTLAGEYPDVTFVYMTGHTDGGGVPLAEANSLIREAAALRGAPLFDVADIESIDPEGRAFPGADDSCPWCTEWCRGRPMWCEGCDDLECAHSHPLMCRLKAGALWWLSARLAGWDGIGR